MQPKGVSVKQIFAVVSLLIVIAKSRYVQIAETMSIYKEVAFQFIRVFHTHVYTHGKV